MGNALRMKEFIRSVFICDPLYLENSQGFKQILQRWRSSKQRELYSEMFAMLKQLHILPAYQKNLQEFSSLETLKSMKLGKDLFICFLHSYLRAKDIFHWERLAKINKDLCQFDSSIQESFMVFNELIDSEVKKSKSFTSIDFGTNLTRFYQEECRNLNNYLKKKFQAYIPNSYTSEEVKHSKTIAGLPDFPYLLCLMFVNNQESKQLFVKFFEDITREDLFPKNSLSFCQKFITALYKLNNLVESFFEQREKKLEFLFIVNEFRHIFEEQGELEFLSLLNEFGHISEEQGELEFLSLLNEFGHIFKGTSWELILDEIDRLLNCFQQKSFFTVLIQSLVKWIKTHLNTKKEHREKTSECMSLVNELKHIFKEQREKKIEFLFIVNEFRHIFEEQREKKIEFLFIVNEFGHIFKEQREKKKEFLSLLNEFGHIFKEQREKTSECMSLVNELEHIFEEQREKKLEFVLIVNEFGHIFEEQRESKYLPFWNEFEHIFKDQAVESIKITKTIGENTSEKSNEKVGNISGKSNEKVLNDSHFTVTCELQNDQDAEVSLHKNIKDCEKNPTHNDFIPVKEFKIDNLPFDYQDLSLYNYIKAVSDLTVRIAVPIVSSERPDTWPYKNLPYPLKNEVVKEHVGTGTVVNIIKSIHKDKECICKLCKTSVNPKKVIAEIKVLTSRHVVFDSIEAKGATCRLFFDEETCEKVIIPGLEVIKENFETDLCELICVTCDEELSKKLEKMIAIKSLNRRYLQDDDNKILNNKDTLVFIVSHPHGCFKHISFGFLEKWEMNGESHTVYHYTTPTCQGSSGALVNLVYQSPDKYNLISYHVHGFHDSQSQLNFSAMGRGVDIQYYVLEILSDFILSLNLTF